MTATPEWTPGNGEHDGSLSVLELAAAALRQVAEGIARHDVTVQKLGPRLGAVIEELKETQRAGQQDLVASLERGFLGLEEKLQQLVRDRDNLLKILCRTHADSLVLAETASRAAPEELQQTAEALSRSLGRALEAQGVEVVQPAEGLPLDASSMEVLRTETRTHLPPGTVLKVLAPGYRLVLPDGYRYVARAQVVVSTLPTDRQID